MFNYALCMLISAIWLGHYGNSLTFGEMLITLFALFKLHFLKTLKMEKIFQTRKWGKLDFGQILRF